MIQEFDSAKVVLEVGDENVVVKITLANKILRIVATQGYFESIERHEFGKSTQDKVEGMDNDDSKQKKQKKRGRKRKKKTEKSKKVEQKVEMIPILRIFDNVLIKYPNGYKVKVLNRVGAPSSVPLSLAITWVREVIKKLELDTEEDIEVFEEEITNNMSKFEDSIKDLLKELVQSWRKYKARKESG